MFFGDRNPGAPTQLPRLKFVWGAAKVIRADWRLGLFGFYERIEGDRRSGLAFSVRGILLWSLTLLTVGYFAAAAALTYWYQRLPYNRIGFVDVLTWPARREHVARLRGEAWLAQGKDALKAGRVGEAFWLLRRGLERCPDDFDARMTLAQLQLRSGQRAPALTLLAAGPLHGLPPRPWREQVLGIAAAGEDWATVLTICDRSLVHTTSAETHGQRQQLLGWKAAALVELGRPSEALALAEGEGEHAGTELKYQRARALLALDRARDAAGYLADARKSAPADALPALYQLEAIAQRDAGAHAAMEATLAEFRGRDPSRPEPLAVTIEHRARTGGDAAAALDEYIFRFGGSANNLLLAARGLAKVPSPPLLERLVAAAGERGYSLPPFHAQWIEGLLRADERTGFVDTVEQIAPHYARAAGPARIWFDWVQALAAALQSPLAGAQDRLTAVMSQHVLTVSTFSLTVRTLRLAERTSTARTVMSAARRLYPESPSLRSEEEELAKLPRPIAAAVAPPVAPPADGTSERAPAAEPSGASASWEQFRAELDELITAGRWTDAQQAVRRIRSQRPAPAWLDRQRPDLTWFDLQIARGVGDPLALRNAARAVVDGSTNRTNQVLALAREWHEAGARTEAILLLRAVLDRSPGNPLAERLFSEWHGSAP